MANCRKSWVSVTNTGFFMKNLLKLGCHFLAYSQELQSLVALSIKNNIIATRKANDENLVMFLHLFWEQFLSGAYP